SRFVPTTPSSRASPIPHSPAPSYRKPITIYTAHRQSNSLDTSLTAAGSSQKPSPTAAPALLKPNSRGGSVDLTYDRPPIIVRSSSVSKSKGTLTLHNTDSDKSAIIPTHREHSGELAMQRRGSFSGTLVGSNPGTPGTGTSPATITRLFGAIQEDTAQYITE